VGPEACGLNCEFRMELCYVWRYLREGIDGDLLC